jgi:hypothetical protein
MKLVSVINALLFLSTYGAAIHFREQERLAAITMIAVFDTLTYFNRIPLHKSFRLIFFGFIMTYAEYICVKFYNIWYYNYVTGAVPLWLPFAWSITGLFLLQFYGQANALVDRL